eukprot:GFUD01037480.1.p1 GENE.GFUD01037480.1~~GFUD01037480.1.p1  ORF type:complete len:764 (+),score=200.20 GFUD01037480.1:264-2555(+)
MAVVGIDIGDHSTYITVAKQGGVETIANDYTQRNTPSIVALGGRQRFMGVSAENQRNLNVKNIVSYFKNFLGRSYKDEYVQKELEEIGADVVELEDGKVGFKIQNNTYQPEQILAMMFTKVKDIVKNDQGEDIETCVVSVPVHFTETQRSAITDAAKIAKLNLVQIMNDTSALALAYGKTKTDLSSDEKNPRYVVFIDCGSGGLQTTMVGITKEKAAVLGSSSSTCTGGKFLDKALLNHLVQEIESKYKCQIKNNSKALNKLRIAVEKIKKQMSANSNKLPFQLDSLVDDIDVHVSIDRATFEELIKCQLDEIRKTFINLLHSTTVKKEQLHSVEIVGGSTRIPAVKQIIQEVFGITPSSSLNADEGVSKGCGLQAASHSDKFMTKKFDIQEVVTNGIEAILVHEGNQEKVLIYDEGDNASDERMINLRADLPVSIALQYSENVNIENKFITLYQIESENAKNADLELVFRMTHNGLIKIEKVQVMTKEAPKRKKIEKQKPETNAVACCELKFNETSLGGMVHDMVAHFVNYEAQMIKEDIEEISRQEAKNMLEEQLYKYRAAINEHSEGIEEEETFNKIKDYFDQTENWLYEEGEDAPEQTYKDILKSFHEKMNVFQLWKTKFMQMKAKEEEKRKFMEQQENQRRQHSQQRNPEYSQNRNPDPRVSRQIPVVYEGEGPYSRQPHQEHMNTRPQHEAGCQRHSSPSDHGYSRPSHADPFFSGQSRSPMFERAARGNSRASQMADDPFTRLRKSPFFNDPLYGW